MKTTKKYEGFWLGRSWVSRCARCGQICFDVAQEEEHAAEPCSKERLKPLTEEETRDPPGQRDVGTV